MDAKVQLYQNDGERNGMFPVKIILYQYIDGKPKFRRKVLSHSALSDWDPGQELPKNTHDDFEDLYGRIMDIRKKAAKLEFRHLENFERAFEYLDERIGRVKKTTDFFTWGNSCVNLLKEQKRTGTAQSYENSLTAFKRFAPQLKFSELNPHLLNDFKIFCKARGNENKTIRHYGGALKAIYNRAVDAGLTEDKKPFSKFSKGIPVRDRRKKQRYLEPEQIRKLEAAELPPAQKRSIDLFLLQFYLGGVDFIEVFYMKKKQLANNRVIFERQKLSDISFEFDVLVPPKAEKILQQYWNPEGEYVFPWPDEAIDYKTFIGNTRRYLGKVQVKLHIKLKPADENLTTKVARHTFATLGKFARYPEDMLREIQGHERDDTDTIYKAKFPEAERDAAQLKIIGENTFLGITENFRKVRVTRKVKRR